VGVGGQRDSRKDQRGQGGKRHPRLHVEHQDVEVRDGQQRWQLPLPPVEGPRPAEPLRGRRGQAHASGRWTNRRMLGNS
jgi:hypothetical protein